MTRQSLIRQVRFIAVNSQLQQVNRGLRRSFAPPGIALPKSAHVVRALALNVYDSDPWDSSTAGFRNRLEGWKTGSTQSPPWLHNRVHVWIGGDMGASTSPNDPVFYLNHANVDRLWEAWMVKHGRTYLPLQTAPAALNGHRIDDAILSPLGGATTPRSVLDVSALYAYDNLP